MENPEKALSDLIESVANEHDADIIAYFGLIWTPDDEVIIDLLSKRQHKRKNVFLFLTTPGGDPDVAYRIARTLQSAFKTISQDADEKGEFSVLIDGMCKSAGTLLALGADALYMTEKAHIGPIDVQVKKPDEVGERTSGLIPSQALSYLQQQSIALFKQYFTDLRFSQDFGFSTRLAAEIATDITIGHFKPIYEQIDPLRLAELEMFVRLSAEYGKRIGKNNLKPNALSILISQYPTHSFVIDKDEARELFQNVREFDSDLMALSDILESARSNAFKQRKNFLVWLNEEIDSLEAENEGPGYNEGYSEDTTPKQSKIRSIDSGDDEAGDSTVRECTE